MARSSIWGPQQKGAAEISWFAPWLFKKEIEGKEGLQQDK